MSENVAAHGTNSLTNASSAYLRSAMHQPIRWHQWGAAAFELARRENKPILLDIGAVWCHWCHVMDRESYDNPDVAAIINEHFIAVKVDRDERPDVDSRYQAAVQAISGQGGWPLTAFLTPDGKPFYGGTYYPPDDHWGRPGFKRVLLAIAQAFRDKHADVVDSAESVMAAISNAEAMRGMNGSVSGALVQNVVAAAKKMFDAEHGGFGSAPKFPHPSALDVLIDYYAHTNDAETRNVVVTTLERMAHGGVYDQLAGGFHRYSTDERWVVPHFEKMSYDNSELLKNYVHAWQATRIPLFADVARDIIRWMDEWLSDRENGGFYASQDADYSMDDDGDYFTWTLQEAREVLNEDELRVAALHYDIGETGEMHHNHLKNVLYVRVPVSEIAKRTGIDEQRIRELLESAKAKMYAARLKRPTPYVDKTIYVGWNALCLSAYLHAARVMELEAQRHFALRSLDRILSHGWTGSDKRLAHVISYSDGEAPHRPVTGVLDDYAFTAQACLDAYEATGDLTYFKFARQIADAMIQRFHDATGGGFFDSDLSGDSQQLGALQARRKPFQDSPTPAGNSVAAMALIRLHAYTADARYRDIAESTLEVIGAVADQFGIFGATYAMAVALLTRAHRQVLVIGNDDRAEQLHRAALESYAIEQSVLRLRDSEVTAEYLPPSLAETVPNLPGVKEGKSLAVLCSDFACQPPLHDPQELSTAIQDAISGRRAPAA